MRNYSLARNEILFCVFGPGVQKVAHPCSRESCRGHRAEISIDNSLGPHGFYWFWDFDYKRSSPDLGNFESAQAGRKEVT